MFHRIKTTAGFPAILAAILISTLLSVATCLADDQEGNTKTLLVRPELLTGGGSLSRTLLNQTRNPFAWPPGQRSSLAQSGESSGPDPFAGVTLNAIIWVKGQPVAIIDNKPLRSGETLKGIKVREIAKDFVVLSTKGARRTLRFPSSGIDFNSPPAEVK